MCGSVEPLNLCNANVVFSLQNLDQKSISISKLRPKIKINITNILIRNILTNQDPHYYKYSY